MSDVVLSVAGLAKKYCHQPQRALWYGVCDVAAELGIGRTPPGTLRAGESWALQDVSFELRRGESLAVIGHNGAGKSTLLKLLYGLLKPDAGEIYVRGRTEALIELGIGFNPILTGRENIRIGAALHGHSAERLQRLLEQVIDFAELADFIDAPVQTYSTGMRARLSYALAAHLEPDLLLVDEVLAVGDFAFQRKCIAHMQAYLARGGSLLLVSHNTPQIQAVCQRGLLLERGRLIYAGSAVEAINQMFDRRLTEVPQKARTAPSIGPVTIDNITIESVESGVRESIRCGETVRLTLNYRSDVRATVVWGFSIWTADQTVCVTGDLDPGPYAIEIGAGELSCVIRRLPLVGGRYVLRAFISDAATRQPLALLGWQDTGAIFDVRHDSPDALTNIRMALRQLILVDVEWSGLRTHQDRRRQHG